MTARKDSMIINSLVRQALTSAQEVMGDHGLNTVLKTCGLEKFIGNFPPNNLEPAIQASQYAKFNEAIEAFYGRGGKGILRRIGKASFQYGVREQSALLGVAGVALKLMPEKQRIKFILNGMADALKKSNPNVNIWVASEPFVLQRLCILLKILVLNHTCKHYAFGFYLFPLVHVLCGYILPSPVNLLVVNLYKFLLAGNR